MTKEQYETIRVGDTIYYLGASYLVKDVETRSGRICGFRTPDRLRSEIESKDIAFMEFYSRA